MAPPNMSTFPFYEIPIYFIVFCVYLGMAAPGVWGAMVTDRVKNEPTAHLAFQERTEDLGESG